MAREKTPVLFVAWAKTPGRSQEIAAALDGEAFCYYPEASGRRSTARTLARYARSFVITLAKLATLRPQSVIVTNPPIFAAGAVALYCAVARTPFVLDSHPAGFGAKGKRLYAKLEPLHRFLARRSRGVLTASDGFAETAERWGVPGIVVHEAPTSWPARSATRDQPFTVFFVNIFASDEPFEAVVEAARLAPEVRFEITGDTTKVPDAFVAEAPPNVVFTGFLNADIYRDRLNQSDLVLSLTTEPGSTMRSAYEAVYARRPLLVTDWPNLRSVFPRAVFTGNDAVAIADAVRAIAAQPEAQRSTASEVAHHEQLQRWQEQLRRIRVALQLQPSDEPALDLTGSGREVVEGRR